LAALSTLDITEMFKRAEPAAHRPAAARTKRLAHAPEIDAEFGCVDWYQYQDDADETEGKKAS
jgi:hypothetical protein